MVLPCDVSDDEAIQGVFEQLGQAMGHLDAVVHSVAFASREELQGDFSNTSREGFRTALDISAYSLIPIARYALPLMEQGGAILTMTFHASERVYPGYNVMGTAKAALENEVRQLAAEMGQHNVRVNALSAGPLDTLAARGIGGFVDMKRVHAERSPLRRNITHQEVAQTALFLCSDLSTGHHRVGDTRGRWLPHHGNLTPTAVPLKSLRWAQVAASDPAGCRLARTDHQFHHYVVVVTVY